MILLKVTFNEKHHIWSYISNLDTPHTLPHPPWLIFTLLILWQSLNTVNSKSVIMQFPLKHVSFELLSGTVLEPNRFKSFWYYSCISKLKTRSNIVATQSNIVAIRKLNLSTQASRPKPLLVHIKYLQAPNMGIFKNLHCLMLHQSWTNLPSIMDKRTHSKHSKNIFI